METFLRTRRFLTSPYTRNTNRFVPPCFFKKYDPGKWEEEETDLPPPPNYRIKHTRYNLFRSIASYLPPSLSYPRDLIDLMIRLN